MKLEKILGTLLLILGSSVIFGWFIDSKAIVQINSAWAPMQFNTALLFVGIGLQVYFKDNRFISSAVVFLAAITLGQYIFDIDLRVDELFHVHSITVETTYPGRMAIPTALCFMLCGFIGIDSKKYYKINFITLFISLFSLLGYMLSLDTFRWFNETSMAFHTAAGFLLFSCFKYIEYQNEIFHKKDEDIIKSTILQLAMEATNIGTWNWDFNNDIFYFNQETIDLFGSDVKTYEDLYDIICPEDQLRFKNSINETISNLIPYHEDFKIILPKKGYRVISLHGNVVQNMFVGIAIDLTDQHKTQEELKRSNTELENFAYITSHDLRAPLRGIESLVVWISSEIKQSNIPNDKKVQEYLILLSKRVLRMNNLIRGILEFSRIGRKDIEKRDVDLNKLLNNIKQDFSTLDFKINVSELPTIHTNKVRISQVFSNLIDNAIKHHHDTSGNVEIWCEDLDSHYKFFVKDDGPGINIKYHDRIFDIFQTLRAKDEVESTGLGLALLKKIVAEYNGEIGVVSSVGEETTFWFTIEK